MITTSGNANDTVQVNHKKRSGGVWSSKEVPQPEFFAMYNQYMNALDRSDQILTTRSVHYKVMRWWKTFSYHMTDIGVVNGFILLFLESTRRTIRIIVPSE